ncbi:uncharacterized protein Dana_GF11197 [Drosophila ananassae]|uniref:CCDC113/CCDC96 coiled-coil domain-containing protein n=1 Tax=Drosophila ananassae TaxID=7217 RepID=B3MGW6_DROAN|nr:putative leucine-rich repeat-containing protein DDB_G0290503 [Drosophila ananassae]EDV37884.1 uncharacterized protein Dana_GF11197 [Drosophila ananassae]
MEDATVVEDIPQVVEETPKVADPAVEDYSNQENKPAVGNSDAVSLVSGVDFVRNASFTPSTMDLTKSRNKDGTEHDGVEAEERKKILRELMGRFKQRDGDSTSMRLSQKLMSIEEDRRSTVQFTRDSPEEKESPSGSENVKDTSSTLTIAASDIYVDSSRDSIDETELNPMQVAVKSLMFVPHLSDISLGSAVSRRSRRKSSVSAKSLKSITGDVGGFKDPTSKRDSDESDSDEEENEEKEESSKSESSLDASQLRATQDSMLDSVTMNISDHEVHLETQSHMELGLDDFLNLTRTSQSLSEADTELPNKDHETNMVIGTFIEQLVGEVVFLIEHKSPNELLRENLDKLKLIAALEILVNDFLMLKDINSVLNERMVSYCRQNKLLRNIQPLSSEETAVAQLRYNAALQNLGEGLDRVAQVKTEAGLASNKAIISLVHINNVATTTEVHLEGVIRKLLVRPDAETDYLKRMVAKELRLMATVRNEISDTRLFMLTRLHTLAVTRERAEKLECVAENVSMNAFVATQANVVALEKKLEERNVDLKKSRHHYHYELHQIQHNREKVLTIRNRLQSMKFDLLEKSEIRNKVKSKLVRLKMERQRMRRELNDLTYRGGILAMPALMRDYDRTVEYVEKKEQEVMLLRDKLRAGSSSMSSFNLMNKKLTRAQSRAQLE